jgi:hypothetical protein
MDLAGADLALKPAGMIVPMLLLRRGVVHPAMRARKILDRPDAVSHGAIMRCIDPAFQPKRLPPSTTSYPELRIGGLSGSALLTSSELIDFALLHRGTAFRRHCRKIAVFRPRGLLATARRRVIEAVVRAL